MAAEILTHFRGAMTISDQSRTKCDDDLLKLIQDISSLRNDPLENNSGEIFSNTFNEKPMMRDSSQVQSNNWLSTPATSLATSFSTPQKQQILPSPGPSPMQTPQKAQKIVSTSILVRNANGVFLLKALPQVPAPPTYNEALTLFVPPASMTTPVSGASLVSPPANPPPYKMPPPYLAK